nr:hypothetical protein [Sinomonas notoginsengisoli]
MSVADRVPRDQPSKVLEGHPAKLLDFAISRTCWFPVCNFHPHDPDPRRVDGRVEDVAAQAVSGEWAQACFLDELADARGDAGVPAVRQLVSRLTESPGELPQFLSGSQTTAPHQHDRSVPMSNDHRTRLPPLDNKPVHRVLQGVSDLALELDVGRPVPGIDGFKGLRLHALRLL